MSALKNHDRPSGTADTAPTKKSRKRRAGGLVAVAAVFAALLSAVAVPAAQAHGPEAKTVCPDGYTLSADETECSKTDVADHGEAECGAGYSLVAKTRGAAVCEKEVGEPTCDEGKGDDCVVLTDLGPPKRCADGSLQGGRCVTDHGSPTVCATGNLKNGSCIGTADFGPPTKYADGSLESGRCVTDLGPPKHCADGSLKGGRCVTDHGPPTCATGSLKNGVCIGTADFGPPKKCATGRYFWGGCIGEVESIASYRCASGTLASGAFGVPVCRHTASKRCPAGYRPLWGGCYHPVTYQTTLPGCPAGYSSSGSRCVKYTSVSWYCTAGQGTFKGPNKCVTTKVVGSPTCAAGSLQNGRCVGTADLGPPKHCAKGSLKSGKCVTDHGPPPTCASGSLKSGKCVTDHGLPTCASGSLTGGRCVGTADLGPPKHCAKGSLKSGKCVTDHGPPTCETGNLKNGVCIGTTGRGTLKCATGQPQGSKCIDRRTPDCQSGSLEGTRCVSRTTDTTAPMNTLNHHVAHDCPSGYYAPPLPAAWVGEKGSAEEGEVITQFDENYQQELANGFYEDAAWERLDATHDCHKPVLKDATKIGVFTRIAALRQRIADGAAAAGETLGNVAVTVGDRTVEIATYCFANDCMTYVTGEEMREGIEAGAKAAWDGLKTAARRILCRNPYISIPVTAVVSGVLGAYAGVSLAATAASLGITIGSPLGWAIAAGAVVSAGISFARLFLCRWLDTDSGGKSVSVPGPASGLKLAAGDKQIEVSWSASATAAADGFGYRVQWKTRTQSWAKAAAASQFEDLDHGDDLDTSYAITGLVNGSAYRVRVAAYNDDGFSEWVTATATPVGAPPGPASGLKLAAGDKQIEVSWSASATAAADGFGYRVQWKTRTQSWAKAANASQFEDLDHGDDLGTSYAITGLSNGVAYGVRVAAFNGGALSEWVTATATPAGAVPGPPSGLELVAGDGQIEVSWSASADTPEAGFGYRVVWKTGTQSWAKATAASQFEDLDHGDDLATSHTITGLSNGSAYRVRVAAFNDGGFSKWIDATATPTTPPEGLLDVKIEGDPAHNSYKNETYVKVVWVWTGTNPSGFQVRIERSGATDTLVSLEHDDRDEWVLLPTGGTGDYTIGVRSVESYVTDTYGDWVVTTHKAS